MDPVRYADALGDLGLAAYRREAKQRVEAHGGNSFAATYAQERLAVLDGDAEAREAATPGDALDVYLRLADLQLETTGKAACVRAAAILKKAAQAARAAERHGEFAAYLATLRETHRRRPTFIAVLAKARLG